MTMDDVYAFAIKQIDVLYEWGGNGPDANDGSYGFDCSGLAEAILKAGGLIFRNRMCAHDLFQWFNVKGVEARGRGDLCFFGRPDEIVHVGWRIDEGLMISAAHGGSWCTNATKARARLAKVKVQEIASYKFPPLVAFRRPKYPFETEVTDYAKV